MRGQRVQKVQKSISELRRGRNMTQQELANIMHCDQSTISTWESGKRIPPFPKILILSQIFDVPIESFKFGS